MWRDYKMAKMSALEQSSGKFNKQVAKLIKIEDGTSPRALTADLSGAVVVMGATGGAVDINLPVAADNEGVYYEFINNAALDGKITVQAKDGVDFFVGSISDLETATPSNTAFNGSSHDELEFASGAAIGHVYVKVMCDGDNWIVEGRAHDVSDIAAAGSSSNT